MSSVDAYQRFTAMLLLFGSLATFSCKKGEVAGTDPVVVPHPVSLSVPANFPAVMNDPYNPLTREGIALGRMLFYDTRLSGLNRLSCASCHRQDIAFSDAAALNNIGESGKILPRHAPALINLAWANNGLFWDGGSTNLESQAFGPLTSADEMHQNLTLLEAELKQVPAYVQQFKSAFNSEVKSAAIVKALAQFERTLISGNSRYDRYSRKESGTSLTTEELLGLSLVKSKCGSCHAGELFTDNGYHNNGIDNDFTNDVLERILMGRLRITNNPADLGKFKTPTLRNVMLTAPYMHDGRFKNIDEVLAHYQNNIKVSPTTDALLFQNGRQAGIPISGKEMQAIKAFLAALTDTDFIKNQKFSKPN
ncbi:cytochrome-c peroxidase [Mucilaginibacter psychrotolerans]|uniref:Cytochrome-c peroxidase n=1 Tax=Mucilaginibacter psychrotolerans TaxID=1524096 RepID=A0A4Y8SLI1_9SPHI|nr:cytochrome c peroxidase [Mucilaginibacter psychrotolerans]TFF39722.1 cytochrome-c peroxidase [Mucilaginibacter psychrotolerans]